MPDIFVPADTSGMTMYIARVLNSGLIYRYALSYTEEKRDVLSEFTSVNDLNSYLNNQSLLEDFIQYAEENGIKPGPSDIAESGDIIDIRIRAYIARNILDNKGFYPIWQEMDTTLKRAIEYIEDK